MWTAPFAGKSTAANKPNAFPTAKQLSILFFDHEDRGSTIEDRRSRIEDRGSRIEDRGPRIEDRGLRIEDRGSKVQVADRFSIFDSSLSRRIGQMIPAGRQFKVLRQDQ